MITKIVRSVGWIVPPFHHITMLCQIRWDEMASLQRQAPDLEGIPLYWALDPEREVHWFPQSRMGEPIVKILEVDR